MSVSDVTPLESLEVSLEQLAGILRDFWHSCFMAARGGPLRVTRMTRDEHTDELIIALVIPASRCEGEDHAEGCVLNLKPRDG